MAVDLMTYVPFGAAEWGDWPWSGWFGVAPGSVVYVERIESGLLRPPPRPRRHPRSRW